MTKRTGDEVERATQSQHAELVGYTGYGLSLEIRRCTDPEQVWDHAVDYGAGFGLGSIGYWVGTGRYPQYVGTERGEVEATAEYLESPIRWLDKE